MAKGSLAEKKLFPTGLPELQWLEFRAKGFSEPVCGVIYRTGKPPCCGVGLGGISTGCIDIDAHGVWGFSTVFNPVSTQSGVIFPTKMARPEPILGLAVGGKTWVLASKEFIEGGEIRWCTEPVDPFCTDQKPKQDFIRCPKIEGVNPTKEIHYWGHYPIADIEYETDAPISVGMRALAPFVPGDVAASNIPAAVFEVHLRNTSDKTQKGTLAFNFPGSDVQEAMAVEFTRSRIDEDFHGVLVSSSGGVSYVLGVIGDEDVRLGGGLSRKPLDSVLWRHLSLRPESWSKIATELPQPTHRESQGVKLFEDSSASAAVDFSLAAGENKIVRFLLAWYAPVWKGNAMEQWGRIRNKGHELMDDRWTASKWAGTQNTFTQMYAARYDGALDVARRMAADHESVLDRIIAWQSVLYAEKSIPVWLRDSLINNLEVLTESSVWAQAKPPLGDWAFPGGAFAMQESRRGCPQMGVLPCDWVGNFPLVFFFPELALSQLRMLKAFQTEEGEVPLRLGMQNDLQDIATPGYFWGVSQNAAFYADMLGRLWQRTGDERILQEFYDSVKQCNTFTIKLRKEGPGSVISCAERGGSLMPAEAGRYRGMCAILAGHRLAQLRIVERMAQHAGDTEYAKQCRKWHKDGSKALEEELWTGAHYLLFYDKSTGNKSDVIYSQMLDGQWMARLHGLEGVFQPDRLKIALETIKRCNMATAPDFGPLVYANPDGSLLSDELTGRDWRKSNAAVTNPPPHPAFGEGKAITFYGPYTTFPACVQMLLMTYMYEGQVEFGLESARKVWENIVIRQRHPWDPCPIHRADTGQRACGTDYYQHCIIWAIPLAAAQTDIATFCKNGGLIDRIICAGRVKPKQLPGWPAGMREKGEHK